MSELQLLLVTAVSIAGLHTLSGPDHYLPFIALSKSRRWTVQRTLFWTVVCGLGHVSSSVLLGLIGAALGWSVAKLGHIEGVRGSIAGWAFLLFGLGYCLWGLWRASQNSRHKHFDVQPDNEVYVFEHRHGQTVAPTERHRVTPWVLFLVFVLGPCEPMIPLLYFPAAQSSVIGMLWLVAVYLLVTLSTMIVMVLIGLKGLSWLQVPMLEKYMHALSRGMLFVCGVGMVWLGW